jgi:hypothetical protein
MTWTPARTWTVERRNVDSTTLNATALTTVPVAPRESVCDLARIVVREVDSENDELVATHTVVVQIVADRINTGDAVAEFVGRLEGATSASEMTIASGGLGVRVLTVAIAGTSTGYTLTVDSTTTVGETPEPTPDRRWSIAIDVSRTSTLGTTAELRA